MNMMIIITMFHMLLIYFILLAYCPQCRCELHNIFEETSLMSCPKVAGVLTIESNLAYKFRDVIDEDIQRMCDKWVLILIFFPVYWLQLESIVGMKFTLQYITENVFWMTGAIWRSTPSMYRKWDNNQMMSSYYICHGKIRMACRKTSHNVLIRTCWP